MPEEEHTNHSFWHELFATIRTAFRSKLFWAVVGLFAVNYVLGGVSLSDLLALLQGLGAFAASLIPNL